MLRARGPAILAAAVIAALAGLAGCGGDDGGGSIPQDTSDEMLATVAEIEAANDEEDCETAQQRTTDLRNQVSDLGDGQVKRSLDAMVTRLDENLDSECSDTGTSDAPKPDEEEEEPTTTTPVEPTTTFEETTTTTQPPPEEEEEPVTPEQPPGEGGGANGPQPPGNPGGGGGGGGTAPPTGGIEE